MSCLIEDFSFCSIYSNPASDAYCSKLKQLNEGKTKIIYQLPAAGDVLVRSKDKITAFNAVRAHDVTGKAKLSNMTTCLIFDYLARAGVLCFGLSLWFVAIDVRFQKLKLGFSAARNRMNETILFLESSVAQRAKYLPSFFTLTVACFSINSIVAM